MTNKKGNNSDKPEKNRNKKHTSARRYIFTTLKLIIICLVALGFALAGLVGGAIYGYISTAEKISDDQLALPFNRTTIIYDSKNNEIAKLTGKDNKDSEPVSYKDIPVNLRNAVIAIEDSRFESHHGIDIKRIMSAGLGFITNKGNYTHGGSTITQQLVKNITGEKEVKLQRKVQEWYQAIELEKKLTKWQILESYLNIIYMGHSCYGVESASKKYFGKDVWNLSLAECALLAGITNNPGRNDPFTEKGRKYAKDRQEIILKEMLRQGKIDQTQYDQAVKVELKYIPKEESSKVTSVQTYFVDQVILDVKQALMSKYNMSSAKAMSTIYNGGLEIHTTMDPSIQQAMDEVYTDPKYFPEVNSKAKKLSEKPQSAMVIIDPSNGQVKAIYGGSGKKEASNTLNRATMIERQPGSSIKPIAVYAPAIDLKLATPATVVDDVPVYMKTGTGADEPYPSNFDFNYDGLTTIRNAIKNSVNVVAAKVWRDILTPDNSIEYLKKVGIDRPNERYISLALGGMNKGVNALQMSAAYVPFVHKGLYYEPTTFTSIIDSEGKTMIEKKSEYHAVYSEQTAFLMEDMMKEVTTGIDSTYPHAGTASARINEKTIGMPVAGKTGTTSQNRDKWFVGYTPYYTAAVWYGYDNNIKPIELVKQEQSQAMIIWAAVMSKVHKNLEKKDFVQPPGIVKKTICIYSGKIATPLCALDPRGNATREEYFIKGTEPRDDDVCQVHVQAKVCKSSVDQWKRNLLAGPNCPLDTVIEKVFIQRTTPYIPEKPDSKYPKDWIYELPAGEYCTVHGAAPAIPTPVPTQGASQATEAAANAGNGENTAETSSASEIKP